MLRCPCISAFEEILFEAMRSKRKGEKFEALRKIITLQKKLWNWFCYTWMVHSTRNDEGLRLYECTENHPKQFTTTAKVMCRIISVFCSWWQNISFRFIWKQIISNKYTSLWHHTNWMQFIFGRINLNLCTFNLRNRRILAACICLSDPSINSVKRRRRIVCKPKRPTHYVSSHVLHSTSCL